MNLSLYASLGFCLFYGLQIVLQSFFLRGSIHPVQMMFLTNVTSFLLLTLFHGVSNKKVFQIRLQKPILSLFLLATALWIIADMSSMIGLTISSSVNLSILSRLQLFITYIGAVLFLGEGFSGKRILAILLAFVGSLLTVMHGQSIIFSVGDILFLIFTVAISISGLLRQKIAGGMSVHQMTYFMYGISSLVTGIVMLFVAPLHSIPIPGFILGNAFLALLGFTCVNYAIGKGGASQFSLVSSILPFITALFSLLVLKEIPSMYQMVGGAVIVLSIFLFLDKPWKKKTA